MLARGGGGGVEEAGIPEENLRVQAGDQNTLPVTGIVLISQRSPIIECIAQTWTPEQKCKSLYF